MWNKFFFLLCICFSVCSVMDPEIPTYDSLEDDPLPDVVIKSASSVYLREATLSIAISPKSIRKPRCFYLCYGKDTDQPDTTRLKVDLLPLYKEGVVDVKITNLLPATMYYCRVYAETRNEKGYSDLFKFWTSTSDADIAWKKVADFPNKKGFYNRTFTINENLFFQECEIREHKNIGGTAIWKYIPASCTWEKLTDFPGGKRCNPIIYVINGKVYMGLGYAYVTDQDNTDMKLMGDWWEYDLSKHSWKAMSDSPGSYSTLMASFAYKNKGYLVSTGAMWDEYPMTVVMFDPISSKWIKKADFPGTARTNMEGFVIGDRMYAGFGFENIRGDWLDYTRDLWEYLPDKDVWEPRAGITMWVPNEFTFSLGTERAGYIGSADYGI
ncbi:MAG: hypothetical protein IJD84_04115 [Parabacteroides sp.]|nr:hypothetical protein [Parabacteroides sp.]